MKWIKIRWKIKFDFRSLSKIDDQNIQFWAIGLFFFNWFWSNFKLFSLFCHSVKCLFVVSRIKFLLSTYWKINSIYFEIEFFGPSLNQNWSIKKKFPSPAMNICTVVTMAILMIYVLQFLWQLWGYFGCCGNHKLLISIANLVAFLKMIWWRSYFPLLFHKFNQISLHKVYFPFNHF